MRDRNVASRYAGALFMSAKADNLLSEVAESYASINEVMSANRDLVTFLDSPQVAEAEKKQLVKSVFGERVEPLLINYFELLIDKNRIEFFQDIGEEFAALVEKEQGFARAIVTTAIELPQDLAEALKARLSDMTKSKIILEKKVEPEVIGGVCVTLGDKILDGTVRTNLDQLKKQLDQAQLG